MSFPNHIAYVQEVTNPIIISKEKLSLQDSGVGMSLYGQSGEWKSFG